MLTNVHSDRVKRVRGLARRSARLEAGHLLVEGPQACREAAEAGLVIDLYLTPQAGERYSEIPAATLDAGGFVHEAVAEYVAAISGDAQGVVAVAHDPAAGLTLEDLLAEPGDPADQALVAVFEQIRDPGNAGTVIRAADAAGAGLVVFADGSVDPTSPKVVRASAGSYFHLPVVAAGAVPDVAARLRACGLQVLAADGAGKVSLFQPGDTDLAAPTAWLFGNEARGLSDAALAVADASVRIPVYGQAESLNLAMAATLCLYGSAAAMAAAGTNAPPGPTGV
ncbi:MAG: RNA methyltransferase [Bifidobacteriaceae bacterium]|jgi:TrmH family RNA methyltransferase|nr:RNA methyltransferase [Bifidobacteriaceae bacterium]